MLNIQKNLDYKHHHISNRMNTLFTQRETNSVHSILSMFYNQYHSREVVKIIVHIQCSIKTKSKKKFFLSSRTYLYRKTFKTGLSEKVEVSRMSRLLKSGSFVRNRTSEYTENGIVI